MRARDSVERLLAVQTLDRRLAELENRRDDIPEVKAEVSREITALENERAERDRALEQVRLDRRRHEGELEMQQEHLARYERQLNDVKTNVAYSALLTEIQGTKRAIGELEDEILEEMERREAIDGRIGEIDVELEQKRTAAAERLGELDEEMGFVTREIDALESRRQGMVGDVDPGLYRLYDRLRRGRRFPALVPLRGTACGACHGQLPPQVIREITHDGSLHPCENCGVLIYVSHGSETADDAAPRGAEAPGA
jgi:predicted  nucleic acid-binding Zn-ribbon protein